VEHWRLVRLLVLLYITVLHCTAPYYTVLYCTLAVVFIRTSIGGW